MYTISQSRLQAGYAYASQGQFKIAEQLLEHCQAPYCKRQYVGSINLQRRACCMGLTMSSRDAAQRHMVQSRSSELCALTAQLCTIFREAFPSLKFSSTQINVNSRSIMHADSGNVGHSAVVAFGQFAGGQLFTVSAEGCPVIHNPAGEVILINGRLPHAVLPFAGYEAPFALF